VGLFPYIGGDSQLASFILSLLPNGEILVEPFGGAGSVSLEAVKLGKYKRVLWNDKDFYVYAAFYTIKYHPEVIEAIHDFLNFIRNYIDKEERRAIKEVLKEIRDDVKYERVKDVVEAGFYTIILHYTCHVPFKSGIMLRWTDNPRRYKNVRRHLLEKHRLLQRIEIMNRDAFELIPEYDKPNVVMYIDPPHVTPGSGYYRLNFTPQDAIRLDNILANIKHAKVLVKLSPCDLPYYKNTTGWYRIEKTYVRNAKPGNKSLKKGTYFFLANYKPMKTLF